MHALAERARHFVRNLSLARKIIVVIMGVSSTALLLACLALVAYDSTTARTTLTRDIGMLADVVGATSTAAVSFSDAKAATESLSAVAVNQNVRMAAIVRNGAVFARFDRERDTQNQSIVARIDPSLVRTPRAVFTYDSSSLRVVRPILLDGELIGGVYIESGLAALQDRQRRLVGIIAVVLFGAVAIAFVLSSRLQRLISSPILRLTEVTRTVSRDRKLRHPRRSERPGRDRRADRRLQRDAVGDSAPRPPAARPAGRARAGGRGRAPPSCARRTPNC